MPDSPWWWNRRHFGFITLVVVLLLITSIPQSAVVATAYADPATTPPPDPKDTDEYVAVSSLPENCQQFAHRLVDGHRVSERGYYLSEDDSPVLKTDNVTGQWRHGQGFCIDQLASKATFRYEGKHYDIYWSSERGHRGEPANADPLGLLQASWILRLVPFLYFGYLVSWESYRTLS